MAAYLPVQNWRDEESPRRPERRESHRLIVERSPQRPEANPAREVAPVPNRNNPARHFERRNPRSRSENRPAPRARESRPGLRSFLYQDRRFTTFKIMSRRSNSTWLMKVNDIVTDELPRRIYSDPILNDPTSYFTEEALSDPDPRSNIPIDLELGGDTYSAIRREGCNAAGLGDVQEYNTNLG
uniref:Uncharacterized protein n=1 Tax=Musca domestica TaxID=7370 RepID=A0A1I8MCC1_MUSDO